MSEKTRKRFIALDSWRGLAAVLVAFGHLKTSGALTGLAISTTSYRFVDFFFVLSGFVIAHSSTKRLAGSWRDAAHFLVRRIARLWPLHVFVLLLFALHQFALLAANRLGVLQDPQAFSEGFSAKYLPANLFLVQAWELLPEATWNKPAWSISTELFAYITFALTCVVLRYSAWALMTAIAGCCVLIAVFKPEVMTSTYSLALVRCLGGFGLGVLAHQIYLRIAYITLPLPSLVEYLTIIAIGAAVLLTPYDMSFLILPVFSIGILVFALEQGSLSRLLRRPTFVFLGERSYSIYLVHAFIALAVLSVAAVFGRIGTLPDGNTGIILSPLVGDLVILLFLMATVAFSHITYACIELPGQRLGQTIVTRNVRNRGQNAKHI